MMRLGWSSVVLAFWCLTASVDSFQHQLRPSTIFGHRATTTTSLHGTLDGKSIDGEFVPTNDMAMVKLLEEEVETSGGLLLGAKAKIKKNEGTVMSVGPGKINQESGFAFDMPLEVGENVLFGDYTGTDIEYNGKKCALIRDMDVLVKYKGSKLNLETAEVLRDNVLVSVEMKKQEEVGGILIAQSSASMKKVPTVGTVVKVGKGRYAMNGELMQMDVDEGDMIKFRVPQGQVEVEGKTYTVVTMTNILMKF
mmetsp:Transcript_53285/g.79596  ORF Transcript_53285/g.79596 Transcript_53285/m.79596 type:complete len:252 (-) Transcript_53285:125-880(-)|eukprot:CAMPEP_0194050264 /NCGR_PEP_ID=MMETSP0009_2-20130614/34282_1 /TAXON_ID=210454 /ORGANISM="Grammatophora oceanica, Strain CCMP 410" /LENGTH=251 /DNA_ID=CAMNT_0038696793 /DNA_START=43 /DNA_END=798 /DNA_ORIENTATION=+